MLANDDGSDEITAVITCDYLYGCASFHSRGIDNLCVDVTQKNCFVTQ